MLDDGCDPIFVIISQDFVPKFERKVSLPRIIALAAISNKFSFDISIIMILNSTYRQTFSNLTTLNGHNFTTFLKFVLS